MATTKSERLDIAELLFDPACKLEAAGEGIVWCNAAFSRSFRVRRARTFREAVGESLAEALAPVLTATARKWTEITAQDRSGEPVAYLAFAAREEGARLLLLRDTSAEVALHTKYRAMLAKERERRKDLEREFARCIREHEDDLAQFSEVAQLGAEVVIAFLEEAHQQVATARELIGKLKPREPVPVDVLTGLLRALHSLKGNSRSLGLNLLGGRTHHAEDLLVPLRTNQRLDADTLEAATQVIGDLDRLVDRAVYMHGRLSAGPANDAVSRARALFRLCDAVDEALANLGGGNVAEADTRMRTALAEADIAAATPVHQLLASVGRTVAAAARELGRSVEVRTTYSGNIRVGRRALRVVESALGHLARNAVVHGIEDAETRKARGKGPSGVITLQAGLTAGGAQCAIEVADDGGGIDPAKVLATAQARGLMPKDRGALSLGEAVALVRAPGFTTAETTTTVSGRGIGLDAVDAMMEVLSGKLIIESTPGVGSTMTVRFPAKHCVLGAD